MSVMIQASPRDAAGTLWNVKAEGDEPNAVWKDFGAFLLEIGDADVARAVRANLVAALTGTATAPTPPADSLAAAYGVVQGAFPNAAPVPAAATAPPQGGAPVCQHGPKSLIEKPAANGKNAWKAWGCPAKRDDPTKCGLDFIRG